jgi:hypothetical protein
MPSCARLIATTRTSQNFMRGRVPSRDASFEHEALLMNAAPVRSLICRELA